MAHETELTDENESIPDKLAQVEQLLEEYEYKLGLSKINSSEPNLSVTREEIMAMHPDDINGLRWDYARHIVYLQKQINKHSARALWAETNLKRYLEKTSPDYPGWKWEERMANSLNASEFAQKLHKLHLHSKMVVERTAFLANKIHFMESIAKDIYYSKRKNNE